MPLNGKPRLLNGCAKSKFIADALTKEGLANYLASLPKDSVTRTFQGKEHKFEIQHSLKLKMR